MFNDFEDFFNRGDELQQSQESHAPSLQSDGSDIQFDADTFVPQDINADTMAQESLTGIYLSSEHTKPINPQHFDIVETTNTDGHKNIVATIIGVVGIETNYKRIIDALETARRGDVIHIHILSPGGNLFCGVAIARAMIHSKGHVITYAMGNIASAASLIWSCGDETRVNPMSSIMMHMSAHSYGGPRQSNFIAKESAGLVRYVTHILKKYSVERGQLTEDELASIIDGDEIYVKASTMKKRLGDFSKRGDLNA